jgi:hypothetical protein
MRLPAPAGIGILGDQTELGTHYGAGSALEAIRFEAAADVFGGKIRGMEDGHFHTVEPGCLDLGQEGDMGRFEDRRPNECVHSKFHGRGSLSCSAGAFACLPARRKRSRMIDLIK